MKIFAMFDFSNYSTKSKYYNDSNKLVIGKIKDETGGGVTEEFVGWMPKMYSFLVENNEHKKAKGVNRDIVATISCNEWIGFKVKIIKYELIKSTKFL